MVTFAATMPQRYDVALLATTVSGVPIQPSLDSTRVPCPTVGTTSLTGINSGVLIFALRFLRAIESEKVGVKRD